MPEAPAQLDPEAVRDFVSKVHGYIDAVRGAPADEPAALVNAAWDYRARSGSDLLSG